MTIKLEKARRSRAMRKFNLEYLESRQAPSTVNYYGGPVIHNAQINDIFVNQPAQNNVVNMSKDLATYELPKLNAYSIGQGQVVSANTINIQKNAISDNDLRQGIITGIQNHTLPSADNNSIYVIFLPQGLKLSDSFGGDVNGYHNYFNYNGQNIYYVVCYGLPSGESMILSHELAEAVTDPALNGFRGLDIQHEIGDVTSNNILPWFINGNPVQNLSGPNGESINGNTTNTEIKQMGSELLNEELLWTYLYFIEAQADPLFVGKFFDEWNILLSNPVFN